MAYLKNILKSKKGASNFESIVWFSIVFVISAMFWTLLPTIFSNEQTSSNQNHTIVSEISIDENTTEEVLNIVEEKEPVTQNIVINNIVKDKNESFLHDFNLNLLADLASTALVGVIGYFVGRFAKKRKNNNLKITKE